VKVFEIRTRDFAVSL